MDTLKCNQCGAEQPAKLSHPEERPACRECGGKTSLIASRVSFEEIGAVKDAVDVALTPPLRERDWSERWTQVQEEFGKLSAPRTDELTRESVVAASRQLLSFFVLTYHLKDALKNYFKSVRRSRQEVENAIKADPVLLLLADLANQEKHEKLDNPKMPPRSGLEPKITEVSGSSQSGGWNISMVIEHYHRWDGLDLAAKAVDAWRRALTGFGLL